MRRHTIVCDHPSWMSELERQIERLAKRLAKFQARTNYNTAIDDAMRLWRLDHNRLRFELNKALYELNGALR